MTITLHSQFPIDRNGLIYTDLLACAARMKNKDHTLWGAEAEPEAAHRMNWLNLPFSSRELLPQLDALSAWARSAGLTNILLAGMGGSSLAAEVIAKTYLKALTVLDTTDPDQITRAIPTDFTHTIIVVGSKSGATIETASQMALFTELIKSAGQNPVDHIVIVTDFDSPLDMRARKDGFRVINADPDVGGRYSALSAFGLVPAALMGVDVSILLDDALAASEKFTEPDSVVVALATAIFDAGEQNLALCDEGSLLPGLSDWIEQLVAESSGKNQQGRLPIVIESSTSKVAGNGLKIGFAEATSADLVINATLGEQFILWEWVTALLCRALGVDPFNQPNVSEAKERTRAILDSWAKGNEIHLTPACENENLQIFTTLPSGSLREALQKFFQIEAHYIAIMAYLNRGEDDLVMNTRTLVASITGIGTTFGWGPRFLHSTGQFHKGGAQNGAFIQITGENDLDLSIPGQDFSFHTLLMAQALGDGEALSERDRPLIRIHLKNRKRGIAELIAVLNEL